MLPDPDLCIYVDIETDGLRLSEITEIHCISIVSGVTGHEGSTLHNNLADVIKVLERLIAAGHTPVFHNGAGYDIGVLKKFYGNLLPSLSVDYSIDTMLLSQMLDCDRKGGHSLEAYGESFGIPKVQNEDWAVCTDHMIKRCTVDCKITRMVYERLYAEIQAKAYEVEEPLNLEQNVSAIHQKQVDYGVYYDIKTAMDTWTKLKKVTDELREEITKEAPWKMLITGEAKAKEKQDAAKRTGGKIVKPFKQDGNYTANSLKFWGDQVHTVLGPHVRIECRPLNLNNSADVKEYLSSLGWKPTEWNYTFRDGRKVRTSPKLTEDSYNSIPEGLGKKIAYYNTAMHRMRSIMNLDEEAGTVKGAVSNIRADGRISADAITLGTPTARYRHMGTVCNIPRPSSILGKQIRETFGVHPATCFQLGLDLKGIESRMLAHYLYPYDTSGEVIASILCETKGEDFHSNNAKLWAVSRDTAKSGLYALMYGCFPKKLASTLGYPESEGERLFADFWAKYDCMHKLNEDLKKSLKFHHNKYIIGLDGRPLMIREERKLLNSLLQNAATVVFKKWMALCDTAIEAHGVSKCVHQIIA